MRSWLTDFTIFTTDLRTRRCTEPTFSTIPEHKTSEKQARHFARFLSLRHAHLLFSEICSYRDGSAQAMHIPISSSHAPFHWSDVWLPHLQIDSLAWKLGLTMTDRLTIMDLTAQQGPAAAVVATAVATAVAIAVRCSKACCRIGFAIRRCRETLGMSMTSLTISRLGSLKRLDFACCKSTGQ